MSPSQQNNRSMLRIRIDAACVDLQLALQAAIAAGADISTYKAEMLSLLSLLEDYEVAKIDSSELVYDHLPTPI